MRILLVISSLGIGGEQRAASNLTFHFVEQGHDVTVLTFDLGPEDKRIAFDKRIGIIVKNNTKNNLYKLMCIRQLVKGYDVVIGFAIIPSILSSFAAIGKKVPVVVCERNDPDVYPRLWKAVRSLAYRFAKGAIFQTNDASAYFDRKYFKKRTVIPNPVRTDIKNYIKPINQRARVIVNTSRLTRVKNQELLIRAFSRISSKYPDYAVELFGEGNNRENLLKMVSEYGLESKIHINPAIKDIFSAISPFSIFVLTSNHEGFPNSLAEAMSLGLACISVNCRIGGPKDMIKNGENGILVDVDDEDELSSALDVLLADDEYRRRLSQNAMELADTLSIQKIGDKWLTFLGEIANGKDKK